MNDGSDNPLALVTRPRTNFSLPIAFGVVLAAVIFGAILAFRAGNLVEAFTFLAIAGLLIVLALVYQAMNRRTAATDDLRAIRWNSAIPELQRQNVNVEVRELARLTGAGDDSLTDLLSAFIVAEDLALRQIQQEENLPLMRHVNIGGSSFDGILVDHELIVCIEVAFLVRPDVRQEKIDAMLKKMTTAIDNLAKMKNRLRLRLMLVLVTQLTEDEEESLRTILTRRRVQSSPVDIDVRMLDFEELQRTYLSE